MSLNCRPGDLAFYVGVTSPKDVGLIVRCVKYVGLRRGRCGTALPMWEISPKLPNGIATKPWCADKALRPIRDQPGDDETLTWAGLPQPSKETA